MKALFPLVIAFAAVAPMPDGPADVHPVALRKERLNRQRQHARTRGR